MCILSGTIQITATAKITPDSTFIPLQVCDIIFTTKQARRLHSYFHLPGKFHKCRYCKKRFSNKVSCLVHERTHAGYDCCCCGRTFSYRKQFARHRRKHRTAVTDWQCNDCTIYMKNETELSLHYKQTHLGSGPNKCQLCGNRFSKLSQYLQHKTSTQMVRSHRCLECEQKFSHKISLKLHKSSKNCKSSKYTCNMCDNKFSKKAVFVAHVVAHKQEKPKLAFFPALKLHVDMIFKYLLMTDRKEI